MKIIVQIPSMFQNNQLEQYIKMHARVRLYKCSLSGNDALTDKRCQSVYNRALKNLCFELIDEAKFIKYTKAEYAIVFQKKYFDDLATFITNGSGGYAGSNILRVIFTL